MILCKKCNKNLSDDATFCPYCGTKAEPMATQMQCILCNIPLEDDMRFCPTCGARGILRVAAKTVVKTADTVGTSSKATTSTEVGAPLFKESVQYRKNGNPNGELLIFDDRCEFHFKTGGSGASVTTFRYRDLLVCERYSHIGVECGISLRTKFGDEQKFLLAGGLFAANREERLVKIASFMNAHISALKSK